MNSNEPNPNPNPNLFSPSSSSSILVVEIGRPIVDDVRRTLGEPKEIVSIQRPIVEEEIPRIAVEIYRRIAKLATGGNEVILVLSGPLSLAFEVGQLVGLSHFKIILYQFSMGRYRPVPPVTRDMLFESDKK